MVNQCTKFEVSRFTHYEATNGSAKCRKWGGFGWLGGTQGHGQCHHSIERIDFLFYFNINYEYAYSRASVHLFPKIVKGHVTLNTPHTAEL